MDNGLVGVPFISRQDLSDYLGKDVTADAGAVIAVDSACQFVRTLTEQELDEVTSDTITVDGTGTDAIVLPELPVSTVGTVGLLDNDGGTTLVTDYAVTDNGVLLRNRGSATDDFPATFNWPVGRQNIQITYSHGGTVPEDLRMVALSLASRMLVQGVASRETVGDSQIEYATVGTDMTNGEKAIIAKYKRRG